MRILNLQAENIKRLVAVDITPEGNLVKLTGKNGSGKTSCLDSIFWAMAGAKAIQSSPIREGCEEGRIRLTLGNGKTVELIVTRTFRKSKDAPKGYTTSLKVDGEAHGATPQDLMDSLLGVLTMDPVAFMQMKPREQFDLFRRFVPDVDFAGIDAQNQIDYSTRTELNRKAESAKAAAGKIVVPSDTPAERVDETALVAELANAAQVNAGILARQSNREKLRQKIDADRKEVSALSERLELLKTEVLANERRLAEAPALPPLTDVQSLQSRIAQAKTVNAGVEQRELRSKYAQMATDLSVQSDALTKAMDERRAATQAAIAQSKLPVDSVTFGEGQILYKGLPLSQASDAEQIRISVEVAMADSPQLRVIRIRQGSLIDSDGMRVLSEIAKARDFDVWIEIVDSSGKVGFVLEDGMARKATDAPDITPTNDTPFPYGKKPSAPDAAPTQATLPNPDVL